ncbi:TonB-dependent receptor [Dechloromonas sp. ZY10]|uniref:TonB-dependent receptor n=1 Tax=Dechloromonas aquae TaxID=2664436 RepID=UPI003529CB1C
MQTFKLLPLAWALAAIGNVLAGESGIAATDNSAVTLGEIKVQGSGSLPARSVLSSVNLLGASQIENQNVKSPWQLFNLMPGVMMTEFNMGTTSGKLSFRGFNGEGEVNAVKLLIDGIPSNSNDGNMPYLDLLFPLDIESIELVKGTNDPRYGLHNIAGNANLTTTVGGNYTRARAALGSFAARELQLAKGIEDGGWSQNYFFAYQAADGWRDHAGSEKFSTAGKWFYSPDSGRTQLGLIARAYRQAAEEPGYLSRSEAASAPRSSPARSETDAGRREMQQVSLHADRQFTERLFGSAKAYLNHIDDRRWLNYGQGLQAQERAIQETQRGLLATLTWRPQVSLVHDLAIEGGVDGEWQENQSQRYNIAKRLRLAQTRDQDFDFNIAGAFVQAVIRPTERFKIIPALRVDSVSGHYVNRLSGVNYDMNDYGLIKQPKLSALYSLTPAFSLYGNAGRSFQVGAGTGAYRQSALADQTPSLNDGWEAGVKFKPLAGAEARVALWRQTAANEMRRKLFGASNDVEAVGKTRRQGLDLELSAKLGEQTRVWVFHSWQSSEILKAGAQEPLAQGKEIDHVPRRILSAGVERSVGDAWRVQATVNTQSDYFLERTNATAKFGAYTLVNLAANYRLNANTSLDFQVRNLFDKRYEYVWYDSGNTFHSPGDGRAVFAAINYRH